MPTARDFMVRLPLPEALMEHYEAAAGSKPLEDYLTRHLQRTKLLADQQKPLIVTDHDRRRLETALGKNFNSGTDIADACERLGKVWLGDTNVSVNLPPAVIERLSTRCYGMPFEQFVAQEITRLLETEVGLR